VVFFPVAPEFFRNFYMLKPFFYKYYSDDVKAQMPFFLFSI